MIIEEYDESLFISRFEDYKRVGKDKNFTYKGLRFLFEYLDEEYDEENPLKLDVISLCCDFAEYKDLREYLNNYSNQYKDEENQNTSDEEFKERIEEEINNNTTLIKFDDDLDEGFIIASY